MSDRLLVYMIADYQRSTGKDVDPDDVEAFAEAIERARELVSVRYSPTRESAC